MNRFSNPAEPRSVTPEERPGEGVRATVVRFPGSNCDEDSCFALSVLGAEVRRARHTDTELADTDLVVLPGGFSYGDYLRSGAVAALSPIMAAVGRFAEQGGLVLGICNGFQLLTEAHLLPGALTRNTRLHFVCERRHVRVEADSPFSRVCTPGEVLALPVAHGEGRFVADAKVLERLEAEGRVVFRYCTSEGELRGAANPNGSANHIAGIVNARGNVCGLMPHPERAVELLLGGTDGRRIFASVFASLTEVGGAR